MLESWRPAGWGINGRIEKFEEHKWQVVEALSPCFTLSHRVPELPILHCRKGTQVLTTYKPQHSLMIRDDTYIQPVHDILVRQNTSPFTLAVGFRTKTILLRHVSSRIFSDGEFPASPQYWPIYLHSLAWKNQADDEGRLPKLHSQAWASRKTPSPAIMCPKSILTILGITSSHPGTQFFLKDFWCWYLDEMIWWLWNASPWHPRNELEGGYLDEFYPLPAGLPSTKTSSAKVRWCDWLDEITGCHPSRLRFGLPFTTWWWIRSCHWPVWSTWQMKGGSRLKNQNHLCLVYIFTYFYL